MATITFDHFAVLLQLMQVTRNLASGARQVCTDNLAHPPADVPTYAGYLTNLSNSILSTINTGTAWATANSADATAAVAMIGATLTDLSNYVAPLKAAAQTLQTADKSTLAACNAAASAFLATTTGPLSVFGG